MKVAAIVYEFPSVSETFVVSQLRGLRDRGCEVSVFADSVDPLAGADAARPGEFSSVAYFGLPLKSLRESYGKYLRTRGVNGAARSSHRNSGPLGGLAKGARLRFEARAFSRHSAFDAICAHFGPNGVRAVRLREKKALRGPVVTSFYGYDVGRRWRQEGYPQLFEQGDRFIALSEHMRSRLVELGCPSSRLVIHRLGVDLNHFTDQRRHQSGTLQILSVARLVEKKGIEYALEAMAALKSRKVPFRYTIAGEGPLRQKFEGLITRFDLGDNVRMVGAVAHPVIAELMRQSDVLLAPSVTARDGDAEGTPVAILEGAASGLAVVASRHAGIPETVNDGVSGFLVEERDASSISERLAQLADDPQLRARMGEAGRAFVTARHDMNILSAELLRLLERVRDEYRPA